MVKNEAYSFHMEDKMVTKIDQSSKQYCVTGMKCNKCGNVFPEAPIYQCPNCKQPGLDVLYDYVSISNYKNKDSLLLSENTMWRYGNFLPCKETPSVGKYVGMTPLSEAPNLARKIGAQKLYIKDDSVNRPTLSYKDRVVAVAFNKAIEFGFEVFGCVSTGNVSNSVAAFAASINKPCNVIVPDGTEKGKLIGSVIYGANLIKVNGSYDDANRLCKEISKEVPIAFINVNMRSYYSEGAKTIIYEIAEQMGWRLPKHIVLPLAGGTLVIKAAKAIRELRELGLIDRSPVKLYGAQAAGSSPIAVAFANGTDEIIPVKPNTIARSLAIGNPGDGPIALEAIRSTNGFVGSVTDEEIIDGISLLASSEGIFPEASGGATVGLTKKLLQTGVIPNEDEVVTVVSGNGYKTPDPVLNRVAGILEIENNLDSLRNSLKT